MLYNIIKQLQDTPSTNDKIAILKANKDNQLLKEYMRLVCCPSINFYITAKTFPAVSKVGTHTFESLINAGYSLGTKELSQRHVTGQAAKNFIVATMEDLDAEHQQLYKMLLLKDIRAKIGATLVNKVWPNLCVSVPYQRCSLPDEKNLKKFKNAETFIVQTKGDGMFASLVLDSEDWKESIKLFTRNGNKFPLWFAEYIGGDLNDNNAVYEGELICFRKGEMLSRKEGNGILNSVMQEGDLPVDISVHYYVWNRLPLEDWKAGKTNLPYSECFGKMLLHVVHSECTSTQIKAIDYNYVGSLESAYEFNNEQLAKGLEGSIIKTLTHKWKDSTSSECLKIKLAVEIDLVCVGYTPGSGKNKESFGSLTCESSCGNLVVDVSGFSDRDRKYIFENFESYKGKILTVLCNDLITNKDSGVVSLFLPRFVEWRLFEKQEPDNLERIIEIFKAKRYGS